MTDRTESNRVKKKQIMQSNKGAGSDEEVLCL